MQRYHLQDLGIDGRVILKEMFKEEDGSVYWIYLVQD